MYDTYDSLSRLVAATTGPEWGLSFTYDGFGNRTAQMVTNGSGPAMSLAVDGNNRVVGHSYDGSGNTTAMPGMTLAWDTFGRLKQTVVSGGATDSYGYDASSLRVWKNGRYFARGGGGEMVAEYTFDAVTHTFKYQKRYGYFAGKVVGQKEDRLGTVQTGSRFYPYGEEVPATEQDTQKLATYYRDGGTGLDYAGARYYGSTVGRFLSPDSRGDDNLYLYSSDPINGHDPSGQLWQNCIGDCGAHDVGTNPSAPRPASGLLCGDAYPRGLIWPFNTRNIMLSYYPLSYVAQVVWFKTEQAYIATALLNRFDMANGRLVGVDAAGKQRILAFGASGKDISSIVLEAAGNNQSWGIYSNGALRNDIQNQLSKILNTDVSVGPQVPITGVVSSISTDCFAVWNAVLTAMDAFNGVRVNPPGVLLFFWNKGPADGSLAPDVGLFAIPKIRTNGNTFYALRLPAVTPPKGGRERR